MAKSLALWRSNKTGPLSAFQAGAFAFTRLDDHLADAPLWKNAERQAGRDPMGLTSKQPNVILFSMECYGGPGEFRDFPTDKKQVFGIVPELFNPRSRGTVKLKSKDPQDNPVVDCNLLDDPLDLLVLTEACRLGNEIIMSGSGTKDKVKGSWPPNLNYHTYKTREEWIQFVKNSSSCKRICQGKPGSFFDADMVVRLSSGRNLCHGKI